jgi:CheY-like chemotaxis protein
MAVGLTFLGTQTGWFDAGSGRALFSTSREYMLDLVGPSATGAVGLGTGTVAIFLVAKLVATSVTVGSGNIAGFVLPTVLLGALAGHLASILGGYDAQLNATEHATLLAAGIAAAIAGTLNCPLAAILIVVEFFGLPFAWVAVLGGILGYKLSPETAVYSLETERAKILVVDDDGSIRRVVRKLLEKSGFGVGECGDGETALQVLGRERYDLLLLDRSLPGQSGDDVLETIRATPALEDLIVVMLTARKATEDRIEGLSEGADDYITKPFNLEELRARVEQHLRRKRREFSTILR